MSDANTIIFVDIRAHLLREIAAASKNNPVLEVFAAWMLASPVTDQTRIRIASVSKHEGALRTYQDIAILGFASGAQLLNKTETTALGKGVEWVAGREPVIDGNPAGFCTDVLALLGIAVGVQNEAEQSSCTTVSQWIARFLQGSLRGFNEQDWQTCILAAIGGLLAVKGSPPISTIDGLADVRQALTAKGLWSPPKPYDEDREAFRVLKVLKEDALKPVDPIRAVFRVAALKWIMRAMPTINLHRPSVEQVTELLRRVPAGLKRWTWEEKSRTTRKGGEPRKWYIENEYHVQNLLWTMLAPIFPDLNDEEYTPPVGPLQPRADILIPSLKLIVEIKFMRDTWSPKYVIEQIAADASLYLGHGGNYEKIVVFLWDASCRIEQHDSIRSGLCKLTGVEDAVIIPSPSFMR